MKTTAPKHAGKPVHLTPAEIAASRGDTPGNGGEVGAAHGSAAAVPAAIQPTQKGNIMKSQSKVIDYPHISSQPEFKAEADKLAHFIAQRAEATAKVERLETARVADYAARCAGTSDAQIIEQAESVLAGKVESTPVQEIQELRKRIDVLGRAISVQEKTVNLTRQRLSALAGARHASTHQQLVKRIANAVLELYAANQAELNLRERLDALGYTSETVKAMDLGTVENPADAHGNITYYWMRDALKYLVGDADHAALTSQLQALAPAVRAAVDTSGPAGWFNPSMVVGAVPPARPGSSRAAM